MTYPILQRQQAVQVLQIRAAKLFLVHQKQKWSETSVYEECGCTHLHHTCPGPLWNSHPTSVRQKTAFTCLWPHGPLWDGHPTSVRQRTAFTCLWPLRDGHPTSVRQRTAFSLTCSGLTGLLLTLHLQTYISTYSRTCDTPALAWWAFFWSPQLHALA